MLTGQTSAYHLSITIFTICGTRKEDSGVIPDLSTPNSTIISNGNGTRKEDSRAIGDFYLPIIEPSSETALSTPATSSATATVPET